jgi:hypothetical protein
MYTERTFHKRHFVWNFTVKTTGDTSGDIILCEPAQSNFTWTRHKSTQKIAKPILWKFTGKMPDANPTTPVLCEPAACAVEMHMDMSQEPCCVEIYRENAGRDGYHLD